VYLEQSRLKRYVLNGPLGTLLVRHVSSEVVPQREAQGMFARDLTPFLI
jgi:hypothetical protein